MLNQIKNQRPQRYLLISWVTAAIIILGLSAFGRPMQHWVFRNLGEAPFGWLLGVFLLGLGVMGIYWQAKRGLKGRSFSLALISIALVVMLIMITISLPQTEERLHFVTFGLFGFFSRRLFPVWLAIAVILGLSSGDELFQAWLPDRVGDWRDVGINIVAGFIGLGFAWTRPVRKASQNNRL